MLQPSTPTVFVVDHDSSVRESLQLLSNFAGWRAETFACADEFLACPRSGTPCCLILEATLPDADGLELQERIAAEHAEIPIIFLTCRRDISVAVRAMKGGALEFLTKPWDDEILVAAIRKAIRRSEVALARERELRSLRDDYELLSPREREVMTLVVSGLPNKLVGGELGITEMTVKVHRGNVMRKMKADSFAHLVNIAARLRITRFGATRALAS
jgi:FixJ family two-component response regulator